MTSQPRDPVVVTFPDGQPCGTWKDGYAIRLVKVDSSRIGSYRTEAEVSKDGTHLRTLSLDFLDTRSCDNFVIQISSINGAAPLLLKQRLEDFYHEMQQAQAKQVTPWPELQALPSLLPEVPAMPGSLLPPGLRPWIEDITERMQVPLEYAAIPAIVAAGSLIGRQLGIYPKKKDDWLVVPNLWGAIVGRSGLLKSPTLDQALKPLDRLAVGAMEAHKQRQQRNAALQEALDAQIAGVKEALKKAAKNQAAAQIATTTAQLETLQAQREDLVATLRRFKTNDATIEKLGELLRDNPQGLLLFRDELSGWLSSLRQEGREIDRSFFLEAWNGDKDFTVDRISRGTTYIPALCLSIVGGIQPGKLTRYVYEACEGGEGDDGLLQRFQLLVWPDPDPTFTYIDRYPAADKRDHAYRLYERLVELNTDALGATTGKYHTMPGLHFTPAAQEVFTTWLTELEQRLRATEAETPAFESHLAKYRSLMPSLALIFHLLRKMEGD